VVSHYALKALYMSYTNYEAVTNSSWIYVSILIFSVYNWVFCSTYHMLYNTYKYTLKMSEFLLY